MTRPVRARVELRRRAVVAGRARDAQGRPFGDAAALTLRAAPPDAALDAWRRPFACHLRPDGGFFFLDVPEGRHLLEQTDIDGAVVRSRELWVPASAPARRWPLTSIDFETAASPPIRWTSLTQPTRRN
jgi:hypothetical protein